jgi:hypothetical protein
MHGNFEVKAMFNQTNKTADYGIPGYHVEKIYFDPLE